MNTGLYRLTDKQKEAIKKAGGTHQEIADKFGLHKDMVRRIRAEEKTPCVTACPYCLDRKWLYTVKCGVKCQNCGWEGDYDELAMFKNRSPMGKGRGRRKVKNV